MSLIDFVFFRRDFPISCVISLGKTSLDVVIVVDSELGFAYPLYPGFFSLSEFSFQKTCMKLGFLC